MTWNWNNVKLMWQVLGICAVGCGVLVGLLFVAQVLLGYAGPPIVGGVILVIGLTVIAGLDD